MYPTHKFQKALEQELNMKYVFMCVMCISNNKIYNDVTF